MKKSVLNLKIMNKNHKKMSKKIKMNKAPIMEKKLLRRNQKRIVNRKNEQKK